MSKPSLWLALAAMLCVAAAPAAFATDGVTLINQATAQSGLPGCPNGGAFPIVICHAGSYRLAGNLALAAASTSAIRITAAHVSLDLNGFAITGPLAVQITGNPGPGPFSAVAVLAPVDSVTVSNGAISGFDFGVQLLGVDETVRAINVTSNHLGIELGSGIIADSQAENNLYGMTIDHDGEIDHCRVASNDNGVLMMGGEVTGSEIVSNSFAGITAGATVNNNLLKVFTTDTLAVQVSDSLISNNFFGIGVDAHVGYGGNTFFSNQGGNLSDTAFSMGNNVCDSTKC